MKPDTERTRVRKTGQRRTAPAANTQILRWHDARTALPEAWVSNRMDDLELEIRWTPSLEGQVLEVTDNEEPVYASASGKGGVTLRWASRSAAFHVLSWVLSSPGRTLANLTARARINRGYCRQIAVALEATSHWRGTGSAR